MVAMGCRGDTLLWRWSSWGLFCFHLTLALAVLWRLRTLGTRQAIQAVCTPCGEKAFCTNLFPSDSRNQNLSKF